MDNTITFEEKVKRLLISNGMFEHMADDVMERIKADEDCEPMARRWSERVSDYPPQTFLAIWIIARRHALEYIDENLPKAWFRPIIAN